MRVSDEAAMAWTYSFFSRYASCTLLDLVVTSVLCLLPEPRHCKVQPSSESFVR